MEEEDKRIWFFFFTLDFYGTCVVSELNARTHTHSHTTHTTR
jgi:hypothetical protein